LNGQALHERYRQVGSAQSATIWPPVLFVMLNLFQHPFHSRKPDAGGEMDPEPSSG